MSGLFGGVSGVNPDAKSTSPFTSGMASGASAAPVGSWGMSAALPSRFSDPLGGTVGNIASGIAGGAGANPQRDAIAQTLANVPQPTADVGTAGGVYKDIFQTPGAPPSMAQQMQTRTPTWSPEQLQASDDAALREFGPRPEYAGQADKLKNFTSGIFGLSDQPHQLDAMGGGAMPPDYKPGPAIAAAGGAGK